MQKLKDEIIEKKLQMRVLEQRMAGSFEVTQQSSNSIEMSQVSCTNLVWKTFGTNMLCIRAFTAYLSYILELSQLY